MVRAKFKCSAVNLPTENDPYVGAVQLYPVYSSEPESENAKFFNATTGGMIQLNIVNAEAAKSFEVGKEYYVDFTPAN